MTHRPYIWISDGDADAHVIQWMRDGPIHDERCVFKNNVCVGRPGIDYADTSRQPSAWYDRIREEARMGT